MLKVLTDSIWNMAVASIKPNIGTWMNIIMLVMSSSISIILAVPFERISKENEKTRFTSTLAMSFCEHIFCIPQNVAGTVGAYNYL